MLNLLQDWAEHHFEKLTFENHSIEHSEFTVWNDDEMISSHKQDHDSWLIDWDAEINSWKLDNLAKIQKAAQIQIWTSKWQVTKNEMSSSRLSKKQQKESLELAWENRHSDWLV